MLRNITRDQILAQRPCIALDWWTRARGMIGRDFTEFDAMVLPSCRAIHTWFMGRALDLIFVDQGRKTLACRSRVRPWRFAIGPGAADAVIELPAGRLDDKIVSCDDILSW